MLLLVPLLHRKKLQDFYQATGVKPKRILFYRDGVGEGMFKQVRSYEIAKIQEACLEMDAGGDYKPLITFVVVQKRNQTR
jgi:eukaryotic translation initiation factor 2C